MLVAMMILWNKLDSLTWRSSSVWWVSKDTLSNTSAWSLSVLCFLDCIDPDHWSHVVVKKYSRRKLGEGPSSVETTDNMQNGYVTKIKQKHVYNNIYIYMEKYQFHVV